MSDLPFGLDFEAALTAADELPTPAAKHMLGLPLTEKEARSLGWTPPAPRKVAPARLPARQRQVPRAREHRSSRGRGRSTRSSARSGDSGDDDSGSSSGGGDPPGALKRSLFDRLARWLRGRR